MFTWLYGTALLISLLMILFMACNNYVTIDIYLWSLVLLTSIINLGYWLQTRATTVDGALISTCIIYIDSTVYMLIIILSMMKFLRINVSPFLKAVAYIIAFGHLWLVWLCIDNDLYYSNVSVETTKYGTVLRFTDGPLKVIHYVYLAVIVVSIIGCTIYSVIKKKKYSKKMIRSYIILLSAALVFYGAELGFKLDFSLLPFLYLIVDFVIIKNYDFLHSHNLPYLIFSQQKVVGAPGYISFDLHGNMLGYNDKALEMIPTLDGESIDSKISEKSHEFKEILYQLIEEFKCGGLPTKKVTLGDRILELDLTFFKVKTNGSNRGYVLNIWDVTENERVLGVIKDQNEKLKQINEVVSAISEIYYILYEMDFVNDTFKKVRAPEYISDFLKHSDSARENLSTIAQAMYVEEDIPKAADFFDTAKWEERLKTKDVVSIDCRGKYVGWTRINLIVSSRTEIGGINKVIVAIENVGVEKEREYQYNAIIDCLSNQYPKVWLIDVKTRNMVLIRNNDMVLSLDENTVKDNYNQSIRNYIEEFVDERDKEHLWYCASFDNLLKVLEEDQVYTLNYQAHDNKGTVKYYSMVFAKASDGNIVLAFKDIDALFRSEQAKEIELKEALAKAEEANKMMSNYNDRLNDEVRTKTASIVEIQRKVVLGVANMIENRDNNTGGHVKRTSDIIKILTKEYMAQYKNKIAVEVADDLVRAAPMHDLGKIAIDNSILCKPGKLTPEEYEIMKTHSVKSSEIVLSILEGVVEQHLVEVAYNVARYHHERWDGKGYPEGLKGKDIPLEARIMAIADVYDALVSKRVYKEPLGFEEACIMMCENMGTQFDPNMESVFLACRSQLEMYYSTYS